MAVFDLTYIQNFLNEDNLIALTQTESAMGSINEDRISALISQVEGDVYVYLSDRYEFPLVALSGTIPDATIDYLNKVKLDIFKYYLYGTKYEKTDPEIKDIYVQYNMAFQKLNQLKKGEVELPGVKKVGSIPNEFVVLTNKKKHDTIYSNRFRRQY